MNIQHTCMPDFDGKDAGMNVVSGASAQQARANSQRHVVEVAAAKAREFAEQASGQLGQDLGDLAAARTLAGTTEWIVAAGSTAYYPLAIRTVDGDDVVSFHSWDVNARHHASAIVLLHNAIPALLKLAIVGARAASEITLSKTPDYTKVGALRECHAALPSNIWRVGQPTVSSHPLTVVAGGEPGRPAGQVQIAAFHRKTEAEQHTAEYLVVMHRTVPQLLDVALAALKQQ